MLPASHAELAAGLEELDTSCSLDCEGGPGMGSSPFGEASGGASPIAVESFHALKQRQASRAGRPGRPQEPGPPA